jgi:HPt (histidine-containing phosphotransfer) domain-containing protein
VTKTGPAQPVPPVYDRAGLLERLGGIETLIPKFMNLFHNGIALSLEGLELAIQTADAEAIRIAAHTIKGSCGNIGAMQMRETAEQLVAAARAGNTGDAPAGLARLKQQLVEFYDAVGVNAASAQHPPTA